MIPASRFIVSQQDDEERWLLERARGVTATTVAKAATPRGFEEVLADAPVEPNLYMQFGTESEPVIMRHAHEEYGILPTAWLIAGEVPWQMASPDGLSVDHTLIAEVKTTGDPWDGAETNIKKIPIQYRRQVQWQLLTTGAERCLFLWQHRIPDGDWFRFAWPWPRTVWIEPDEKMQADLIEVGEKIMEARNG